MSATQCYRCNLPIFGGISGYVGPQCQCFMRPQYVEVPKQESPKWKMPMPTLTEEDVRRIVREEIAKGAA